MPENVTVESVHAASPWKAPLRDTLREAERTLPLPEHGVDPRDAISAAHVEGLMAGLLDASVDAARICNLAARCCRSDLLAMSLNRRALDHAELAQKLRRLQQEGAGVARHGGSFCVASRCLFLNALNACGLLGESGLARACAQAERRLLGRQEAALQAGLPMLAARAVRRPHEQSRRGVQGLATSGAGARMRSA